MAILGKNLILSLNGTAIAAAKACSISRKCETIETASATSGRDKTYIPGRREWSVSCSGLILSEATAKANLLRAGDGILYTLTYSIGDTTVSGSAYCVDAEISGSIGNLATYSCKFKGTGTLV